MKNKTLFISLLCCSLIFILFLPACAMASDGSIKSITKPYIAQYRCIEARLGGDDLLDEYDFITITFLDGRELEVSFKPENGEKHSFRCPYTVDPRTHEISSEAGILGYKFKEKVIIENGGFVISKPLGDRQLVMKFQLNG